MRKFLLLFCFFLLLVFGTNASETQEFRIKIIQTTDIHGNYFPYDFIERKPGKGSLSRVYSYVKQERQKYGKNLILLDNGDILQGQPTAYYYNFINKNTTHLCAQIMNYMGYQAASVGNHDIETGPDVYDRFIAECNFPWMAANALKNESEDSYFKDVVSFEIDGIKISVLGMITQPIPLWLPRILWKGMRFLPAEQTALSYCNTYFKEENNKPDILLGLFHLSYNSHFISEGWDEGGGYNIAYNEPGFDAIMLGHDHHPVNNKIANAEGDSVVIINPGANGNYVSDIELILTLENGKIIQKNVIGKLVDMNEFEPDPDFMAYFEKDFEEVKAFTSDKIANLKQTISSRDAFFGPSTFTDLIHRIQLDLTDADISFTAPLSFDTEIKQGDVLVSDMFKLYKYENFLYTMNLTGREIKDFLEYSYTIWTNQMKSPDDHLLLIEKNPRSERDYFVNPYYNFDSAAGVRYTVDVTKPQGEKIRIYPKMKNGKTFDLNTNYKVAINSYRGNGGGAHLTDGAKIPQDELNSRIESSTSLDLRYYLMSWMKEQEIIIPSIISDWKFIPEKWAKKAGKKDYKLLFNL